MGLLRRLRLLAMTQWPNDRSCHREGVKRPWRSHKVKVLLEGDCHG